MSAYDIGMNVLLNQQRNNQARIGELTPQGGLVIAAMSVLGTIAVFSYLGSKYNPKYPDTAPMSEGRL